MIIQGRINFKQVDVLLDTGSSVNIIPKIIISQIKGYHNVEYIKTKIATINGEIEVLDSNPGNDKVVCKCIVPSRHRGTLNSRQAASPLVRLVARDVRWEAPNPSPGCSPTKLG
ncbi:hypothetical protein TNCV_2762621 [Trichonephila clavipes]|nr:hypothetical protein TNCV_2762621 [Trichonephila clavipes]